MQQKRRRVGSLAALLLAATLSLSAQRYNFRFYGEDEGLMNLAVQVLLQDRAGFLWVGSQNGLFRFDGSRFVAYGRQEGLPGTRVDSIHQSIDGTLWVLTPSGLARLEGDRFTTIALPLSATTPGRQSLASDRQGNLYVATLHGLLEVNPSPGSLKLNPPDQDIPISSVFVDSNGSIWYGCGNGLCLRRTAQEKTLAGRDIAVERGLPRQRWDAIAGDLDGNLWVRSESALFVQPAGTTHFQPRDGIPPSTNTFPTLAFDPAGRLLVPTDAGLERQTDTGWQLVRSEDGVTTNDISTVLQDREGSIWLGLLGSGLARWLGYNEWQSWTSGQGLSRESIWSFARDTTGRMWAGSQFGLNLAEPGGGRIVWRTIPTPGLNMIRSMAATTDGGIWIGGDPGGLVYLARNGAQTHFSLGSDEASNRVRHVMVDATGFVWASTRRGLFRGSAATPRAVLRRVGRHRRPPPGAP